MKETKNNILIFSVFTLLLLISSCSKDGELEDLSQLPNIGLKELPIDSPEGEVVNPSESTVVYSRKDFLKKFRVTDPIYLRPLEERLDTLMSEKQYYFDVLSGKCFNSNYEIERGDSNTLECNVPSSVELRNDEFENYNFFGADARSVSVSEANVSLYDLVFAEVKFNHDSTLNLEKKPFYKLFQNQKRVYFGQKNNAKRYSKALNKYYERRRALKKKFKSAKNEKQREKIKQQVEKINTSIRLVKLNHKISKKKSSRHLKELKWISKSEELVGLRDKFSHKNRESTFFDGATAYQYLPSNEVFETDKFSISLWFRTNLNQQDKRLFNMHRAEHAGSALNLSLKNDKIVMGIHDGTKYISNEYDFVYDDNQWHNFIVTKSKKGLTVYINATKAIDYMGSFSGFGTFPVMFGSYNGKGYYFSGDLDEISLWSKNLSKSDIKKIYNSGSPTNVNLHPSSVNLKRWWRMGDSKKDNDNEVYESISKTFSILVE